MNSTSAALAEQFVPVTYVQQGLDALRSREKQVTTLLAQRRLPDKGWDDASVELLLQTLSAMDSNNFLGSAGAGEREARVFSPLVARRHFHLAHGIGRSGDVAAVQPKAAGSSLMVQVANALAKDVLHLAGMRAVQAALVLPVATGMSLMLVLLQLKVSKPNARYVVWPRIDQKSCFKSILAAGLTPLILANTLVKEEDESPSGYLKTDLVGMAALMDQYGSDSILAVMSTTSCFAPRAYDSVKEIAELCQERNIAHVINNAYGVQASKCVHQVELAMRTGRVDAVVQSLDKNFMVPVGGAIVCSASRDIVDRVAKYYPGRASATPTLDFFITILQMGKSGYRRLLEERKQLATYMREKLDALAIEKGERVLHVSNNEISFALTLGSFCSEVMDKQERSRRLTLLGAMLFSRGVSGARVVSCLDHKTIAGHEFPSFGAHYDGFPVAYVTFACALGMRHDEVDLLVTKLRKTIHEWRAKLSKQSPPVKNQVEQSSALENK
ncbi:O-phosphoseryl-tRNA(Sec) selenium transferase [Phytophthora nicotianae CJ01A1]|uniref:O-phosphoseryl-tRNA(Sec) selenium transferase n=5 Tax=Phytophthora nicotianae TaxID=4792 RepID=V9FZ63_PHYNI|nr:O-phosphoseryl-tRNA(Sec) selenium transferase, variant [Phytophthora nicotianae P1569]ETK96575.1 O-phosphoseryl-tRNA(Sec) selenium transferase, variant [Phytophthora nicotianae]ETO85518.1 O-phosphoseryl-tRNA(Sec) selenium transferase [Phytophthora nicotianae P1976]ETP26571.1 O-phosphoseryl-tRNA(Sec) selenium transferase [Phytophthora nicotianae CJ01A1]ETP54573.1 O-phosphoseryl-tRNA(Sec) selenium transferase, variant [Phytophthora nicotianae P10297]